MAVEQVRSIRKAHPTYKTSTGEEVPGVTTVVGLRAKEALVGWAFKLGKENPQLKSSRDYVDELAAVGSAAHEIISAHLKGIDPDLGDFTPNTVKMAQFPVSKYMEWERGKKIELLFTEKELVSDTYRFGGTVDMLARIDGVVTVLDFKTGKKIYDEMLYQVAAYAHLVEDVIGLQVEAIRILQIGRVGREGFTERVETSFDLQWRWFLAMREVYQIEKDIDRESRTQQIADPQPGVVATSAVVGGIPMGDPNDMKNWAPRPAADVIPITRPRRRLGKEVAAAT